MEYTVISNTKVCGKVKDEKLTKDDILSAGGNVEHLLASGHIKAASVTNAARVTPAVKEVPAVQQEPEVPVFNSVNNEQGDK